MTTVQAIETVYKGYRFRSRLEARWAVYLDAMQIEWEYEKEGYTLPDGTRYLPDFWLPELTVAGGGAMSYGMFLEVKSFDALSDIAAPLLKCIQLLDGAGEVFALAFGLPHQNRVIGGVAKRIARPDWLQDVGLPAQQVYVNSAAFLPPLYVCGANFVMASNSKYLSQTAEHGTYNLGEYTTDGFFSWGSDGVHFVNYDEDDTSLEWVNDLIRAAENCAKQARFEHGQEPIVQHGQNDIPFLEYTSRR